MPSPTFGLSFVPGSPRLRRLRTHNPNLVIATLAIGVLFGGTQAFAQTNNKIWTEQGPAPILNESNTALPDMMSPASGAINAIVPSPNSPDLVFVGTVSGGVWKTSNATAAAPTWIQLTDSQLPQLPVNSLAMSPVDFNTLFAGTGSTTSFDTFGSLGIGVARSTDGGVTWKVPKLAATTFTGRAINSIVPTALTGGTTILAATWLDEGGVYRSIDNGDSFTRISGNGTSGLPDAGVTSLIAGSRNATRFYAAVPAGAGGGALAGVYRSNDGGLNWIPVNTGLLGLPTSSQILLTTHIGAVDRVVYAAVIATDDTLSGVFRSTNHGGSWTSLGVPSPPIYPGKQGSFNGAFAADPSNPNVVFIAGDRQNGPFPPPDFVNGNGCNAYNANVFRYTGTAWENIVCKGANGTAPHPDSRFMAFDASGNLLQASDGGIVRLVNPNTAATRKWVSVDGDIGSAEFHSIAYNSLSKIVFGGTQDNGTPIQSSPNGVSWNQVLGGDGGVVGIDAISLAGSGSSLRYYSTQNFRRFTRSEWSASNTRQRSETVGLNITAGPGTGMTLIQFDPAIGFYQPFALNAIDPSRMLIGTNRLYESLNNGDSLNNLGSLGARVGFGQGYGRPIAYGGRLAGVAMPDVFYVGAGATIFHRVTAGGLITKLANYPGGAVITIAMNPYNYKRVYVSDINNNVWGSRDEGVEWVELTGDLQPSLTQLVTTIQVFSLDGTVLNTTLFAGGFGVFQLTNPSTPGGHWTPVTGNDDSKIPPALVLDLHYDYTKNVLVAGTLGRGAWLFGAKPVPAEASRKLPSKSSLSFASTAAKNLPPAPPGVNPTSLNSHRPRSGD